MLAASTVSTMNPGSRASDGDSATTRHTCASTIRPKAMPVVRRYAFMFGSSRREWPGAAVGSRHVQHLALFVDAHLLFHAAHTARLRRDPRHRQLGCRRSRRRLHLELFIAVLSTI